VKVWDQKAPKRDLKRKILANMKYHLKRNLMKLNLFLTLLVLIPPKNEARKRREKRRRKKKRKKRKRRNQKSNGQISKFFSYQIKEKSTIN
jgi:hypothetical protein